jgi:UDPglucose 6-dehydrogenase/UDP-N-acetyl-D-galactosamine dehydrogenase
MIIKGLNEAGKVIKNSKILIMGLTYKENVPDIRESPVKTMIEELNSFEADLFGYDPLLAEEQINSFDVESSDVFNIKHDCVVFTVMHDEFKKMTFEEIKKFMNDKPLLIDVRGIFDRNLAEKNGFIYKTL